MARVHPTGNTANAAKTATRWSFLTNHAAVLICIADDPGVRLRDMGQRVGITERAAHRIVAELADAGYVVRERDGRRNLYTINDHLLLPDPIAGERRLGELLDVLRGMPRAKRQVARKATTG